MSSRINIIVLQFAYNSAIIMCRRGCEYATDSTDH